MSILALITKLFSGTVYPGLNNTRQYKAMNWPWSSMTNITRKMHYLHDMAVVLGVLCSKQIHDSQLIFMTMLMQNAGF